MKIQKRHLRKFSRLTKELMSLLEEVREYCPEACYRLNNCESLQFGIETEENGFGGNCDCPYYIEEDFYCESINDIGNETYCLLSDEEAEELSYVRIPRIKGQRKIQHSEVKDFYNGYCNSCLGDPMPIEEFAKRYLGIFDYQDKRKRKTDDT